MERVGTLINKLKEQFERQECADKLAVTAHLILGELQKKQEQSPAKRKVSVVLPSFAQPVTEDSSNTKKPVLDTNWLFETQAEIPTLAHQEERISQEVRGTATRTEIAELNKVLAVERGSLNEKLKEEKTEVMTALQDTPVRDLKKAIGINDRYLFVNELFRGDENMYERSIKTINGFSIFPEAQYWIQRELKVKLSWPDNSETVKLFDQLIKRRFS
jgi:hypothetical protein